MTSGIYVYHKKPELAKNLFSYPVSTEMLNQIGMNQI